MAATLTMKGRAPAGLSKTRKGGPARTSGQTVEALHLQNCPIHQLDGINALRKRRGALTFRIGHTEIQIAGRLEPAANDDSAQVRFETSIGSGRLTLPGALLQRWLQEADSEADHELMNPEYQALLLEAVLAGEIEWLEEKLRCTIELTDAGSRPNPGEASSLSIVWKEPNGGNAGIVEFDDVRLARDVGTLLDSFASRSSLAAPDIPVPMRLIYGVASVSVSDLEGLERGDVILFPMDDNGSPRSCCLIGGLRVAPMARTLSGWQLSGEFLPLRGSEWDFNMTDENTDADEASEDADFAELPILLVFEAGRTSMPLNEVRRLGAGSLVPLNAPADASVTIYASGKRVGRGELVRLGDGLGVRIVNIFDNG